MFYFGSLKLGSARVVGNFFSSIKTSCIVLWLFEWQQMVGSAQSSEQCVIDSKSLHWRWWRALIQNKRTRIRWWSTFYSERHYNNAMRAFSLITAHLRIFYGKSAVLHLIDGQFITWQSDREKDWKIRENPLDYEACSLLLTYNDCPRDIIFCKFRSKLYFHKNV